MRSVSKSGIALALLLIPFGFPHVPAAADPAVTGSPRADSATVRCQTPDDAGAMRAAAAKPLPDRPPMVEMPVVPALGVAASAAVFDELRYRMNLLEERVEALETAAGIDPEQDLPPMEYSDPDYPDVRRR
jgi:hypothetical protein